MIMNINIIVNISPIIFIGKMGKSLIKAFFCLFLLYSNCIELKTYIIILK